MPTATATAPPVIPHAFVACLAKQLRADAARDIASGVRNPTFREEGMLGDCLMASALGTQAETPATTVYNC